MPKEPDGMVCVGAIAGAFGVRGEARIKSFCAEPEAIGDYGPLTTEGGREFKLKITRPVKDGFGARLTGVATREDAEALKGTRLYAPRARLPALDDDEYYHADLIGLEVVDTGGVSLGRVRAIHDFGAGDVLDVLGQIDGKTREQVYPFTRAAVPTVDVSAGRIVVDLSEVDGAERGGDD